MHKIAKFFLSIMFVVSMAGALALGALFYMLHHDTLDFSAFESHDMGKPTLVLDDEGNELFRFQLDRRKPIALDDVPEHVIQAFLAAEDHNFFQHAGLSWRGIIRSTLVNISSGRRVQGASTITQQVVRLLFFDAKKTFSRKIKEQLYAVMIERQFSKEHILEMYLNNICLGCGIYGVEAACQRFWGKSVRDVTVDQAATLAGIVKSPRNYCPLVYPLSAQKRRNVILSSMKRCGFISPEVCQEALETDVVMCAHEREEFGLHIQEMLRQQLEHLVGKKELYTGGFIVQSTINRHTQAAAEKIFKAHINKLRTQLASSIDGALLSVDAQQGEVKALIGGVNFFASQFNRATQARRQIGSTIKPVVYAAALMQGMSFADTALDEPLEIIQDGAIWRPHNDSRAFYGTMTLARALSHSNNIITIKTLLATGAERVAQLAHALHLGEAIPAYPSLALGCIDCSLEQVVGMFNVFTNYGVYVQPHALRWVKDPWGKKVWKHKAASQHIMPAAVSDQVVRVLSLGLNRARRLYKDKWLSTQAFGKTGTTNDSRTSWFVGASPTLTTGIYIGRDDNKPLGKNLYGVKTAFPIWLELYRTLTHPVKKFSHDSTLREVTIHAITGQEIPDNDSAEAITILRV